MAAVDQPPGSVNSSQDTGGQKSMLELLSITDAAVKALNKSTRSTSSAESHASRKSHHSDPADPLNSDRSGLSQVSKKSGHLDPTDPLHSDRSVQSAGTQSSRKSHLSDPFINEPLNSDRSVKSSQSGHSLKSAHSGQSVHSQKSGHSNQSRPSVHSSQSQEDNLGAKSPQPVQDVSHDSGVISKTQTISENKGKAREVSQAGSPEGDSDVSTTASDVLIHSTHDKSTRSIIGENGLLENVSTTSKCSKTSFGVENFNSSGPQKVKISRRRLKEIKAPTEEEGLRDSASSDEKVPSSLLSEDGKSKRGSRTNSERSNESKSGKSETGSQNGEKITTRSNSLKSNQSTKSDGNRFNGAKTNGNFTQGIEHEQFRVEKVRKSTEKAYDDINMVNQGKSNGRLPQFPNNGREKVGKSEDDKHVNGALNSEPGIPTAVNHFRSTPKYFVERHTPQKKVPKHADTNTVSVPERKNLLKDLEDSVEIVTAHAKDASVSSSQPEIITIPERIVTVTAKDAGSPASTVSEVVVGSKVSPPLVSYHSAGHRLRDDKGIMEEEKQKSLDESDAMIPPALPRQFKKVDDFEGDYQEEKFDNSKPISTRSQWFSKQATGHGLLQGAPVNGHDAPDKQTDTDVQISDFKLTDKQRFVKESFAKRQGGPIRRVVQPRLVGHDSKASSTSSVEERKTSQQLGQSNDQVLTAAAAASAAVAATQPFLKAQYEMEARMAELVEKINELQKGGGVKSKSEVEEDRIGQLERQLTDVTEKRIDYMEKLQEQQMAMQAKLLSFTRDASSRSHTSRQVPVSPESHIYIHSDSQKPSIAPQSKAFSKTTVHRPAPKGEYSDRIQKYSSMDQDESMSPLHTPAPRSRAPKPTLYDTSDIDYRSRTLSPKGRSPKAKSPKSKPRSRSKSPFKENQDHGILHQILASNHSPPVRDTGFHAQPRQPVLQERNYRTVDSPNVKKAKGLVEDLSFIKEQVKTLAEDKERLSQVSFTQPREKEQTKEAADVTHTSQINSSHVGPSPLDSYLKMPEKEPCSPYKSVPDMSFSHFNAPLLTGFKDAESILRQVQKNRGILESNLETVSQGRKEVEVYSVLETLYNDSSNKDLGHIQKMVDSAITKLRREVQREVTDDVVIAALKKKQQTSVPGAVKIPEPAPTKPGGRYGIRSRLQEQKREPKVEPKKQPVKKPVTSVTSRPQVKKPAKSMFEDEAYMTQIYGKASYQKGRTTVKDPYLHFQNTAKPKPARPAAVKTVKGTEVMSSKTQTGHGGAVRQFYFNPNTGTYIPIASIDNTAPIPGQLIPMAVPLGGPRIDSGLSIPTHVTPSIGPVTFGQGQTPQVTADGNVAMVSIGTDEGSRKHEHVPELGKQVLPSVDIDTDISEISEVLEEKHSYKGHMSPEKPKKSVQIISPKESPQKTPGQSRYEVIYHEDDQPRMQTEEAKDEDSSNTNTHLSVTQSIRNPDNDRHSDDTLVDEEDDVETATGMELPGYQPVEAPELQYNGPAFPPKQPSTDRQMTSELIAEDIRRRDLLQNQATDWLEQELMARIITEIYPLKDKEEPAELSHVVSETSEDSMAEEKEQSMFIMDSIGHRGMQLFVDAGYPVDNALVNDLVKEVLQEKIRTMLGQRPDQEDQTKVRQDTAEDQYEQDWEEPVSEEIDESEPKEQMVKTPEPTPKTSPASSPPPRRTSAPLTPPASPRIPPPSPRVQETVEPEVYLPPAQPVQPAQPMFEPDSEPESSASYDIKEEMNRLAEQLRPNVNTSASLQSRHDVATPPESPKPEPQPFVMQPLTPPDLSPRPVEEVFTTSQKVMPAGMSAAPGKMSPYVSKSDTPKSPTSAQISDEMPEEIMDNQPQPVMFTVAETQTEVVKEVRKARSPSPARDKSRSRSPSESSITESSSISDTYNENVSEGQWLINKSDGEMADFPVDANMVRNRILRTSHKRVDVSSASTWKDADDIDLEEMTDASKSEGEFLYRTDMPPEKDPVLHLLARLQHDAPQYGLYNLSNKQVTDVLNNTGKSEGEVIRVAPSQQQQQQMYYQQQQSRPLYQQQQQQLPFQQQQQTVVIQSEPMRSKSPQGTRNEIVDQRSVSPTRGILKQTSSYDSQQRPHRVEDFDRPVRDSGRSVTPTGRLTPGGRQPQAKGMISAGGRTSPMKSKSRTKPPQVIKSNTMPETRGSGPRLVNVRGSSEEYRGSMENTGGTGSYFGTGSDYGTRTMTPDQMNMDALIQSGYLSQSFSQSDNGKQTGRSSVKSSGDLRLSRTTASNASLGMSYGTDGSLTESELQRLATRGTGKFQMSLTLPGADGMEDSDISELDISGK